MNHTSFLKNIPWYEFVRHCVVSVITAWCLTATVNMLRLSSSTFNPTESLAVVGYTSLPVYAAVVIALSALLTAMSSFVTCRCMTKSAPGSDVQTDGQACNCNKIRKIDSVFDYLMFASVFFFAIVTVILKQEIYTCLAVTGLVLLSFLYAARDMKISDISIDRTEMIILISIISLLLAFFIGITAIYKYLTYNVPNFDGGLFIQMFYYMKNHLTMQNTLERDMLMSHMQVHISPAFWLIFPIYFVFPYQETVLASQGIVLAAAVIPLAFLCRKKGVSRLKTAIICTIYCFMPYVAGGCGYDIHENMFLPVALFCLLYAFECESWLGLAASLAFVLSVKEDAAIYSCFIGLYVLFGKETSSKKRIWAVLVMAVSVVYFALAVSYVSSTGVNTTTERFNNMIYSKDGNVLGMIPTILLNPAYTIKEMMREDNLKYIVTVLAPMLFLPLKCKDYRLYILTGPFLMFNLMPDYVYSHDITFQYTFGSGTLLFYMMIENINADNSHNSLKTLCMCGMASILFFASSLAGRTDYIKYYYNETYREIYDTIDEALSYIPDDAEVTSSTFISSHLAQRDIIYEDVYTYNVTEYKVIDLRGTDYDYDVSKHYETLGYTTLYYQQDVILVLKRR